MVVDMGEGEGNESLAKKISRLRKAGRYDDALALEPEVRALPEPEITPHEEHLDPDVKVKALTVLAFTYLGRREKGDEEKALELYGLADKLQPNNPYTLASIGEVYLRQQKEAQALAMFEQAIAAPGQKDSFVFNAIGRINLNHKRYAKAEKYFEQSLQIDPDNLPGLDGLGRAYMRGHKYIEAGECFKKIPDDARTKLFMMIIGIRTDNPSMVSHYAGDIMQRGEKDGILRALEALSAYNGIGQDVYAQGLRFARNKGIISQKESDAFVIKKQDFLNGQGSLENTLEEVVGNYISSSFWDTLEKRGKQYVQPVNRVADRTSGYHAEEKEKKRGHHHPSGRSHSPSEGRGSDDDPSIFHHHPPELQSLSPEEAAFNFPKPDTKKGQSPHGKKGWKL